MAISLYDATIPTYLQLLGSLSSILDKARAWAADQGLAEEEIVHARLAEDMADFAYQVKSAAWHSWGAIEGVRAGNFSPDWSDPPQSFAAMIARTEQTIADLRTLDRTEVDGWVGQPMQLSVPASDFLLRFTAENFLLSLSLPNFYFHVTTAYDILRWKGMGIGKMDYLGAVRVETE